MYVSYIHLINKHICTNANISKLINLKEVGVKSKKKCMETNSKNHIFLKLTDA